RPLHPIKMREWETFVRHSWSRSVWKAARGRARTPKRCARESAAERRIRFVSAASFGVLCVLAELCCGLARNTAGIFVRQLVCRACGKRRGDAHALQSAARERERSGASDPFRERSELWSALRPRRALLWAREEH